jgi:hypothetical protein
MVTRCSAFFAAMKANFIGSASRRTPWPLGDVSFFFRDPERFAAPH